MRIYDNNLKNATGLEDDYTNGSVLDYSYFKEHYKMIAIDSSKQQALYASPKGIQPIYTLIEVFMKLQRILISSLMS